MSGKKKSLLDEIWTRGAKVIEEIKLKRSTKILRGKAELQIIDYDTKVEECKKAYEDAIEDSREEPNFLAIVDARIELKKAGKAFEYATETFIELFGKEPRKD